MKRLISWMLTGILVLCLWMPAAVQAADNPVPRAKEGVVCIAGGLYLDEHRNVCNFSSDGRYGIGTGFGVSGEDGDADIFATNWHVVSDKYGNVYPKVLILIDGADVHDGSTLIQADVLYANPEHDCAIIQAENPISGVRILPLGNAADVPTGDEVFALGFPGISDGMADTNHYTVEDITVTDGIVSRHVTHEGTKSMAHTAKINHGNSGGPLITGNGTVIGMNTWSYMEMETADTRYYAIYMDYTMEALDELGISYTTAPAAAEEESGVISIGMIVGVAAAALAVVLLVLVLVKKKEPAAPAPAPVPVPAAAPQPTAKTAPQPRLSVAAVSGPLSGSSWILTGTLTIGRDPGCSIVYPSDTQGVSRRHCRIDISGNQIFISDLGSSYGTYVNGQKLVPNQSLPIDKGAEICIGSRSTRLVLR